VIERILHLPEPGTETFFLWGPRQTGKSTLLRNAYPGAFVVDLLKSEEYRRYLERPELLRRRIGALRPRPDFVVIDEVQKVPALLDEAHWLHENWGVRFALCGSSARKVRRGHANLMGGRALRHQLEGLVSAELGEAFDLERMLNHGTLPRIHLSQKPGAYLAAYVADYLKEEVAAEGLVRNLPAFSEFLNVAALSDTELVNHSTIARDCGVSSPTVKGYFDILTDTMLGHWLPAWKKRPKRRVIGAPKFYLADVGVAGFLARRGRVSPGSELFGKALENYLFHELRAWNQYRGANASFTYWRLASGIEVDFIVNDMQAAIEVEAARKVTADHLKGLRHLLQDHPEVGRRYLVCLEERPWRSDDGIDILPVGDFLRRLWADQLF
jgi:predicted AAA+ superfamily ATPase